MRSPAIILLFCFFISNTAAVAMEVDGVDIPDTLALTNSDISLVLNATSSTRFSTPVWRSI